MEAASVRFDGLAALEGVSLELRQGEIVGLIGPNGAGKTTLLNVFSGYQRLTSGSVRCGSDDVTREPPNLIARRGVARTFQNVRTFPRLTVRENIELGSLGHGSGAKVAAARAKDLLADFDLGACADLQAGALPYGAERVLGIARAIAAEPTFLLLDEPAAGMDETEGDQLIDRIRGSRDRYEFGVLLVEHDMQLIMSLSERIHVLDYGKTLGEGPPSVVRRDPKVIEAYFGTSTTTDDAAA